MKPVHIFHFIIYSVIGTKSQGSTHDLEAGVLVLEFQHVHKLKNLWIRTKQLEFFFFVKNIMPKDNCIKEPIKMEIDIKLCCRWLPVGS